MTLLTVISVLVGIAFGLRFKVLILPPAIACALFVVFGIGLIRGDEAWSILLAMVFAITALQLGYFFGAVLRFVILWARLSGWVPLNTATAPKFARQQPL